MSYAIIIGEMYRDTGIGKPSISNPVCDNSAFRASRIESTTAIYIYVKRKA